MSDKPYNSPQLDAIRQRIDTLDNTIHDALMERAELVLKIGEEKRRNNIQIVQPAREARMIRRLLERHKGVLPQMAVVRIWRELVGAVSLLQTGLKAAVTAPEGKFEIWDMARDYFGSCLPMNKTPSPLAAISAVREDKATFAVVPWPENEEDQPWWAFLGGDGKEAMQVIIRLPHGDAPEATSVEHRALVVSKAGFDESGDDNSFLLIQCDPNTSRAKMVDVAKKIDMEPLSLSSMRSRPGWHLMEVKGYLGGDHEGPGKFASAMEDEHARITCVGGYPVPAVYSKVVTPQIEEAGEPKKASA